MAYILVHRNRLLAVARSEIKTEEAAQASSQPAAHALRAHSLLDDCIESGRVGAKATAAREHSPTSSQ